MSTADQAIAAVKKKGAEMQDLLQKACELCPGADGHEMNIAKTKATEAVTFAVRAIHQAGAVLERREDA